MIHDKGAYRRMIAAMKTATLPIWIIGLTRPGCQSMTIHPTTMPDVLGVPRHRQKPRRWCVPDLRRGEARFQAEDQPDEDEGEDERNDFEITRKWYESTNKSTHGCACGRRS